MPGEVRAARLLFEPSGFSLWLAGSALEYLVSLSPPMCTCPDFSFRLSRGRPSPCKHLRAVLRAAYWGTYEEVRLPDSELLTVIRKGGWQLPQR
ncbi:MAG: SWIM zinc finger family protein [Conexivisphaera sp.]